MKPIKEKFIYLALAIFTYLIPFSGRRVIEGLSVLGTNVTNDFTRVFIFGIDLVLIIFLAGLAVYLLTSKKQPGQKILLSHILILAFIVWIAISFYLAREQSGLGLAAILRLILASTLFLAVSKLDFTKTATAMGLGLTISGVVQSLIAIQQFVLQKSIGLHPLGESPLEIGTAGVATFAVFGERMLRAYGTMPHPNSLAVFLAISMLASYFFLQKINDKKYQLYIKIALAIMTVGLLLTFSRLVIFLLAVVFTYLLSTKINKQYLKLGTVLLALIIFTSIIYLRPVNSDSSYFLRKMYQRATVSQIMSTSLTGVGLGQQVLTGGDELREIIKNKVISYQDWMHQPVHNSYLLMAVETGILGLLIFIGFLASTLARSFKQKNKKLMVIIVAGLLALATDHMFFSNPNILYLMFLLFGLQLSHIAPSAS